MTCPKCGSSLEVEDGLDIFYCKYCGTKIQLSGMSKAAYQARTREKELEFEERENEKARAHELKLREQELKLERKLYRQNKRESRRRFVANLVKGQDLTAIIVFLVLMLIPLIVLIGAIVQGN